MCFRCGGCCGWVFFEVSFPRIIQEREEASKTSEELREGKREINVPGGAVIRTQGLPADGWFCSVRGTRTFPLLGLSCCP